MDFPNLSLKDEFFICQVVLSRRVGTALEIKIIKIPPPPRKRIRLRGVGGGEEEAGRGVDVQEMAAKGKANVRIENEIEKSREESDWRKLIELAEQLKARSPNHGNKNPLRNAVLYVSP